MDKTCIKCDRLFTSIYLLNKHLNKKISCDIVLECIRCKKIFKVDKELSTHLNKKIPCLVLDTKLSDKLALLNLQDENKIKMLDKKSKLDNERIEQKRQDMEIKQRNEKEKEELKLQNEREMFDQKAKAKHDLTNLNLKIRQEMQERKSADLRYLDETKTKRKMMTAKMINDQVIFENQRAINDKCADDKEEYIKMYNKVLEYVPINKYTFSSDTQLKIFSISQEHMEDCIDMFNRINSSSEYIIQVLEIVLQNKNLSFRNIFYNPKLDIYCVISHNHVTGKSHIIYKKYDQILKILHPLLNFCYMICAGGGLMTPQYKYANIDNKEISEKFEKFKVEYDLYLKAIKYNDEMIAKEHALAIMPPLQKNTPLQIEPKYEMDMSMEMEIELNNNNIKALLEMLEYNIKKNTSF